MDLFISAYSLTIANMVDYHHFIRLFYALTFSQLDDRIIMTVNELIEELKKFPPNLSVICTAEGGHVDVPIDWVMGVGKDEKVTKTSPYKYVLLGEN